MLLQTLNPVPAPTWPLAAVAAVSEGAATFGVLSLFFSAGAGGAMHFGTQDASDEDLEDSGSVLGRISSWPLLANGFAVAAPRLGSPRYQVTVDDGDGELEAALIGESQLSGVINVVAKIRVGVEGQSATLWPVWKTLVLTEWMNAGEDSIRLVLRHADGWLTRPVCQDAIHRSEWPYARTDAIGRVVPVPVGSFDSRTSLVGGALEAAYVDTRSSEWRFLVAKGWYEVPRVYVDNVLANGPSHATPDYAVVHTVMFSAYYWTFIEFTADPGADAVVRCDVSGPDPYGNGTGAGVQTPLAGLRHMIAQGMGTDFGALGGTYTDAQSWAEVEHYLQGNRRRPQGLTSPNQWSMGRRAARIYADRTVRLMDALNDVCQALGVYPYWHHRGVVALAVLDHRKTQRGHNGVGSAIAPHHVRLFSGEAVQHQATVRGRQRLESAGIIAKDDHAPPPTASTVGTSARAEQRIPNRWAAESIHEADLWPYVTTQDSGWTETGGGTDPSDSVQHPAYTPDTRYTSWAAATGTFRVRARHSPDGPQIPQGPVVLVEVRFRAKGTGTAKAGVYIGGVAFYDTTVGTAGSIALTTTWTDYLAATFLLNPSTVATWLSEDVNPDLLQLIVSATGAADVRALRAVVHRLDGGPGSALVRERLSRQLALQSVPAPLTVAEVDMMHGAIRPGDPFSMSTDTVVGLGGDGWGELPWEKRLHILTEAVMDFNGRTCSLVAVDARELQAPLWETGICESLAPEARGVLRLGAWPAGKAGAPDGRQFHRITADDSDPTGEATITAPWGGSEVIPADHEKYTDQGLKMQAADISGTPDLSPDILRHAWRHDYQCWPIHGGSAVFHVNVQAMAAATIYTVFRFGSDVLVLHIDDDKIRFRRTIGATNYDVELDITDLSISTGDLALGIRWTPGEGGLVSLDADQNEQDTPPYTMDLWARQGGITTHASPVVAAAGQAAEWLYLGSDAGVNQIAGGLKLARAWHALLTDEEMVARLEVFVP